MSDRLTEFREFREKMNGREEGVTRDEFFETFNVALVVGGSITIPHLRRAVAALDLVEQLG